MVKALYTCRHRQNAAKEQAPKLCAKEQAPKRYELYQRRPLIGTIWYVGMFALLLVVSFYGKVATRVPPEGQQHGSIRKKKLAASQALDESRRPRVPPRDQEEPLDLLEEKTTNLGEQVPGSLGSKAPGVPSRDHEEPLDILEEKTTNLGEQVLGPVGSKTPGVPSRDHEEPLDFLEEKTTNLGEQVPGSVGSEAPGVPSGDHGEPLDFLEGKTANLGEQVPGSLGSEGPSLSPEARACQEMPKSIEEYVEEVHQDIEHKSLRAWNSKDGRWSFPRLDSELLNAAFGNKRVALIGDSTLFNILESLNPLLNNTKETKYGLWSDTMALQEWFWANHYDLNQRGTYKGFAALAQDEHWVSTAGSGHVMKYDHIGAEVMWTGYHGPNMHESCKFKEQVWPNIRKLRPDVIVANWGIHMVHHGAAYPTQLCKVHQFLHYEEWLDTVLKLAKEVGTKVLLFKTTNIICTEKQPLKLQEGLAPLHNNTQSFLDECVDKLKRIQKDPHAPEFANLMRPSDNIGYTFSEEEMYRYCGKAAAGDKGVNKLNHRMREFVENAKQDPSNSNIRIELFNDHDLESCEYTHMNDGIHFVIPSIARIKLLSQMIKCMWTTEEEDEEETKSQIAA